MAFGGVQVNTAIGEPTNPGKNIVEVTGLSLGATVGAFGAAAADSGVLTTAAPGVNENGLPSTFGMGRGKWTQSDVDAVEVLPQDMDPAAAPSSDPRIVNKALVAGDLVLELHNKSAQPTAALVVRVTYVHSGAR